jgi:tetratricopeptide (TPR) repeat protein
MSRRTTLIILLLLAGVTALIYGQSLDNGFVGYDDPEYVTRNDRVRAGLSADNVAWAFGTLYFSNWHPLTWLAHMAACEAFDLDAGGHHAIDLALHVANALLLFAALRYMTGAVWPSALVAALFAWHPLHVESVAWVSERKDTLSTFFMMLTILAYARYARGGERIRWYAAVMVLFALGLMSKAMLVTLPAALLLLDYWPLARLHQPAWSWRSAGRLLLEKVPLLLLAAGAAAMSVVTQSAAGSVNSLAGLPLGVRVQNALVSYGWYLLKTVWPTDLAIFYPHPATIPGASIPIAHIAMSAAALVAISAVALLLARRRPYVLVGWLWFLGTLVPVIGLVQVGGQARADRYTYIPLIGVFIAIAWWIGDWANRSDVRRQIATGGAVAALIACLALTWRQARYWHDDATLFGHAIAVTQNNYVAYNNLGTALAEAGEYAAAEAQYREAVRAKPDYANGYASLGATRLAAGDPRGAVAALRRALEIEPNHPAANNNMGNALAQLGRADDAEAHYRRAVAASPALYQAQNNLAMSLATRGQFAEAAEHARMALRANPTSAEAHHVLGLALAMGGGDPADGVTHLRRAIALRPDWAEAINSLAWVLAGRPTLSPRGAAEAVELASRANELTGYRVPKYLDTLALAKRAASHRSATTATTVPARAQSPVTRPGSSVP